MRQFSGRMKAILRTTVCDANTPFLIPYSVHTQLGDSFTVEQKLLLADVQTVRWK